MPHITLEYSANLAEAIDVQGAVDALHLAAAGSGLFDIGAIRTRAARREQYRVGDGDPANGFVQVIARFREGRDPAQVEALGEALFASLNTALARAYDTHPLAVTLELHEITQRTFRRNTVKDRNG
ncbi:5-carboxymethyl-2-hydroxymuconate Delta-isomerase [Breoghania sp. L-A4]|uniref:5-carboxymethyl-2-hydroxymuconate Delta-isomerase n=1 Tax=Breoghania sp. L-A4 TaxID=2304600 RepID=UPI000E359A43|nr:5-carboxymethyl-2-hydroxymuconate Delta-isomerase [Breoghania sp. L-A4]AXS41716.1 5-carboxymethyl-2-hydroxymuconate Delta-isomerase [Breoghania sp. L-A4]